MTNPSSNITQFSTATDAGAVTAAALWAQARGQVDIGRPGTGLRLGVRALEHLSREHLPDAVKAFGVKKAWRFCSASDPSVHQATYEFADQAAADRATSGEALKPLVAEFDRCWPDVKRTREIFVLAEELGAG